MTDYRSEIRASTVDGLFDKVANRNYGKYLLSVVLAKIRGFKNRQVTFDFPVTALVGPNGGGKTTILGAAGLVYDDVKPRQFFAKSGRYDASMRAWSVEYTVLDKSLNPRLPIQRTASFPEMKWNRHALPREVHVFGVARTVPASERAQLTKAIGNSFTAKAETALSQEVRQAVERILSKDISGYKRLQVDTAGRVTLFAGQTGNQAYSEFHFGAGEASVIRIVSEVEAAADNCLILVEEIENGLHPIATRRMVEYFIEVAQRKSAQVIFTTHSNDALAPLPARAIWAAYNGEVLQGKLDVRSLRTITGQIDAKLAIFVEDEFAEMLAVTALRYLGSVELDAVKVHGMGGAGPAKKVNEQHNLDPTSTFESVCILDGDQHSEVDADKNVFAFPGDQYPEAYIFERVLEKLDTVVARLTVSMQLPASEQERVKRVVSGRALTNHDRHIIFEQIGEDLDFTAAMVVAGAFLAVWAQEYRDELLAFISPFVEKLPRINS